MDRVPFVALWLPYCDYSRSIRQGDNSLMPCNLLFSEKGYIAQLWLSKEVNYPDTEGSLAGK